MRKNGDRLEITVNKTFNNFYTSTSYGLVSYLLFLFQSCAVRQQTTVVRFGA